MYNWNSFRLWGESAPNLNKNVGLQWNSRDGTVYTKRDNRDAIRYAPMMNAFVLKSFEGSCYREPCYWE